MQIGFLFSRAAIGYSQSDGDLTFGQSLWNNALASVLWSAPIVLLIALVNYLFFYYLFRALTRSGKRQHWQNGLIAAVMVAVVIILLNVTAEWISTSLADVKNYSDRTPVVIAQWLGNLGVIVWSSVAAAALAGIANNSSRASSQSGSK
ncbi:hypothetical protein QMK22_09160 [Cryobacterium sp. PH29-G1]|nr:hypothetical protein [Cryobacterium sp. PH29-G1]